MPPLLFDILARSWRHWLPYPWAEIALVSVAVVCGGIIGGERQRREKPAGLRTLMLVCLGSALFTITGYAFTTSTGDSGRVAAQIVTGIGFLGAGVILHGRGSISGMTTAATIWATAAIGMLVATGYACGGLGASLLVRFVLYAAQKLEIHQLGVLPLLEFAIVFSPDGGKTRLRIERTLGAYPSAAASLRWSTLDEHHEEILVKLRLPQHHLHELLGELADLPEVLSIHPASDGQPAHA